MKKDQHEKVVKDLNFRINQLGLRLDAVTRERDDAEYHSKQGRAFADEIKFLRQLIRDTVLVDSPTR